MAELLISPVDQVSSIIDAQARAELKTIFANLSGAVKMTLFTQANPCPTCAEQRRLLEEVASVSGKIDLKVYDLVRDRDRAEARSVDKVPATLIDGDREHGIRFYGLTGGYEFSSLVDAILMASTGVSSLDPRLESLIKGLSKPVHVEVMTTLTCPYCPRMVHVANQFALVNDKIRADMIDSAEYPQLVQMYSVSGVPKTIINGANSFEGAIQAEAFYLELLKAVEPEQYRRLDETIREAQGLRKVGRAEEGHLYEVLVIGGGPAGMNAALYSARKGLEVALVSMNLGGQITYTARVENYLGLGVAPGVDVIDLFMRHLEAHRIAEALGREVIRVEATGRGFRATTGDGRRYEGRALIYCAGKEYKRLEVPGEEKFIGRGIAFCATCDAPLYTGRRVAVVGGGNSAFTAARDLIRFASEVHLIHRGGEFKADEGLVREVTAAKNVKLHRNAQVRAFLGGEKLTGVRIGGSTDEAGVDLLVDGVFLEVGMIPNSDPLRGLVEVNERGEVPVGRDMSTAFPGLFAAGDVTDVKEKQIAIAVGQGAQAALSAYEYLYTKGLTKNKAEKREAWQ
jgi:alkyl hydroperoxide reductase subunit F